MTEIIERELCGDCRGSGHVYDDDENVKGGMVWRHCRRCEGQGHIDRILKPSP